MAKIGIYRQQPTGYKAFVPEPFPSSVPVEWDNDLIFLLSLADRAIGKLNAIDQLVPDVDFFIFMYVRKEAALSSQIEGTQATLLDYVKAEVKLADDRAPSDVDEIKNYIEAMNYGLNRLGTLPLSWRLVKEIHAKLLKGVRGEHKTPGEFRRSQNWIGGPTIETAVFVPPPPHEMQEAASNLEKFFHDATKLPPLIKAGLIHAQFETIHPFLDGNGRTGRLLITFYLCQEKILMRPLLYLSEFFKKNRRDYYDKLNDYRFSEKGTRDWLKFFLEGVRFVSEEAVTVAKNITKLHQENVRIVSGFGRNAETALKFLNALYRKPVVDAALIGKMTGITSKANVSALIEKFVKAGILYEITGKARYRRFLYRDYVRRFSDEKI
ncbi:MAG: Adenosine monophosphate-protein transferase SoFic [Candidatus Omnitrophica bacterium ADurb.Bin292]|jgi:Fic family protein|nr:MAG: Adenosine monophosphate-protein transferase SoFic [Candidatus Omnitrophica bacterium ADurb.Bin292]HPW76934.1 Fic family protein [Candidatus Omnitrophota bacterium]